MRSLVLPLIFGILLSHPATTAWGQTLGSRCQAIDQEQHWTARCEFAGGAVKQEVVFLRCKETAVFCVDERYTCGNAEGSARVKSFQPGHFRVCAAERASMAHWVEMFVAEGSDAATVRFRSARGSENDIAVEISSD